MPKSIEQEVNKNHKVARDKLEGVRLIFGIYLAYLIAGRDFESVILIFNMNNMSVKFAK